MKTPSPQNFDDLKVFMTDMFDIIVTTETKLNNFLVSQLHIGGFSMPHRLKIEIGMGTVQLFMPGKTLLATFCQDVVSRRTVKGLLVEIKVNGF